MYYQEFERIAQDPTRLEQLLDQLSSFIGAYLGSVPAIYRNSVLTRASRKVGSSDVSMSDDWRMIPPGAPFKMACGITKGMGSLAEALMGANPNQTVAQVVEDAKAIAEGIPVTGDPTGESPLPSAAAVLLQSAVNSGEGPDVLDPEVQGALIAIDQFYDCATHNIPLGGGLVDSIKSWWKGTFGSAD